MNRRAGLILLALIGSGCGAPGTAERAGAPAPKSANTPPNIVVFLVDTLRADAVGFGGSARETTPQLDRWSRDAAVYRHATTPAGWTRTAVISLFSALCPAAHGVQDERHSAADELLMLAEVLKQNGYLTQAFVSNFAVDARFGTAQGFDRFRFFDRKRDVPVPIDPAIGYVPIYFMNDEVERFFRTPPSQPFFAYVHTTDPHQPYRPPIEFLKFGRKNRDRYDGEVLFTDHFIAGWIETMRAAGVLDRTLVVFTSDHGEEFEEHGGAGHGHTLFEEIVRIPLAIAGPRVQAGQRDERVSLLDLGPTLLELAGLAAPPEFGGHGRSFAASLRGVAMSGWDHSYHELIYPTKGIAFALSDKRDKLLSIASDSYGRKELSLLFDLQTDPAEQHDRAKREPELSARLRERLKRERLVHQQRAINAHDVGLDAEALERLRTLGYVQ
jgi:arylsulfatase A-like enzyme